MTDPAAPPPAMTFTACENEIGRVDRAVALRYPESSRSRISDLFAEGAVRINGKRAAKGDRLNLGDSVELRHAPVTPADLRVVADPEALARVSVLWTDPHFIAIAKPSGMPSHPLRAGETGTAANAIVASYPECADVGADPREAGLVHRLDTGTSGVLLAARDQPAWLRVRDQFRGGLVEKVYLALVASPPARTCAQSPLAQRGDHVVIDYQHGLPAQTDIVEVTPRGPWFLVRCQSTTGRMHQIRAHLAELGSPLVGDTLYGGVAHQPSAFFLHAARLSIPGLPVVEAPLPQAWPA